MPERRSWKYVNLCLTYTFFPVNANNNDNEIDKYENEKHLMIPNNNNEIDKYKNKKHLMIPNPS